VGSTFNTPQLAAGKFIPFEYDEPTFYQNGMDNPVKRGNIRDYASINELIWLSNMENVNAVLIEGGLSRKERLIKLNKIAIHQMSILEEQTTKILK